WDITGSSTSLCSGVSAGAATDCPSGANKQLNITITNGVSVSTGDVLNFGLIAASSDTVTQKKLQFGPGANSFRKGHSKLTIASGGGFVLTGKSDGTVPSLMDWMATGSTYYTFVDSG